MTSVAICPKSKIPIMAFKTNPIPHSFYIRLPCVFICIKRIIQTKIHSYVVTTSTVAISIMIKYGGNTPEAIIFTIEGIRKNILRILTHPGGKASCGAHVVVHN